MDSKTHWEKVYTTKAPEQVSWYRPHLETSIALIEQSVISRDAPIIDVGGGESTLVDDLLARGFQNVTVLDVSQVAIETTKKRLGQVADRVHWLTADVTQVELQPRAYDVWHDRAVFHFLTRSEQRSAYVRQVALSVKPGGYVIISAFGPEGPTKCSASMSCVTTPILYTMSLVHASAWSKALKNCTRHHSARHNSFCIATAELGKRNSANALL